MNQSKRIYELDAEYNTHVREVLCKLDLSAGAFKEHAREIASEVDDFVLEYVVSTAKTGWVHEWLVACKNELIEREILRHEL